MAAQLSKWHENSTSLISDDPNLITVEGRLLSRGSGILHIEGAEKVL